jgi:uncharacterized membrane protein
MKKNIVILILIVFIISCAALKTSKPSFDKVYTNLNNSENQYFWQQFHEGNIENVDSIIRKLEAQYQKDSTNLITNAHLGFAHIWALSEWQRIPNVNEKVTDHAYFSYKHFTKAYKLNPNDKRILGFLADIAKSI